VEDRCLAPFLHPRAGTLAGVAATQVIVVAGLPGSGKSTVANGLGGRLGLPVLSVDPIESAILASGIGRSFETGLAAYLVAQSLAAEQLRLGLSVVIDAVSPVEQARMMWRQLAAEHDAALTIIECILDPEIHRSRIEARVRDLHGIPEVTWSDVEERRVEYAQWHEERHVLDTSRPVADVVAEAVATVRDARPR
jgi:predicted kinase